MPFRFGLLGVQLLFVLSGYCIHRNQARGLAAGETVKLAIPKYAFRRFFRIYPTYVAALIVCGLLMYALIPWLNTQGFATDMKLGYHSWYVFGMNLLTMQDILVPPYEGVYWSLSIEIHLYIAYPFLLWITRRYGPQRMLAVTFAAALLMWALTALVRDHKHAQTALAFLHFGYFWFTWTTGAYVAELQYGRAKLPNLPRWVWAVTCALFLAVGAALGFIFMARHTTVAGVALILVGEPFVAVAMAIILYAALRRRADVLWASRPGKALAFLGTFSYSLYAVHVPVLLTYTVLGGGQKDSMLYALLGCLVALVVAYIFFNIVERWTLTPPKGFFVTKKPVPTHIPSEDTVEAEVRVG